MSKVLSDEALREKLILKGLKRAQQFSWEKTA
jgi:glycosyltransferase involved in cell wall biosynthesis